MWLMKKSNWLGVEAAGLDLSTDKHSHYDKGSGIVGNFYEDMRSLKMEASASLLYLSWFGPGLARTRLL